MPEFVYKGEKTREISFPLGGIGSGSIGLAGNGRLVDWEIFNRPNKGGTNGASHFSIKAERDGKVLTSRVLNGDLAPPYNGEDSINGFDGYGFGPYRGSMAGFPHFREVEFRGEFPIAQLAFIDTSFPGRVSMLGYNPYIPTNDGDSSIPAAFFEIEVENTTEQAIEYTVACSLSNPHTAQPFAQFEAKDGIYTLTQGSEAYSPDDPKFGGLTVATDSSFTHCQEYWFRGQWFDALQTYWRQFSTPGPLPKREYPKAGAEVRSPEGDTGTLAARIEVDPGAKGAVRFIVSWHYPNCTNYWNPSKSECCSGECCDEKSDTWKNYYATLFRSSLESATYGLANWDKLLEGTKRFKEALFATTMPEAALEAISANLSILKTPTCLRLSDGSFYGFEGCHADSGCCEGSCTHVWNYSHVLPFLFPALERSMRTLDYMYNQRDDGGMSFRLQLPVGRERSAFRPCADGQFGGVVKTYRDWKISGDSDWLRSIWPAVKKSIEFAWADTNEDRWDADKDGVLEGRQHHTLDMELFGPNSWLTGYYLAALKAGAEIADFLGESETAREYRRLFSLGKEWVEGNLYNGEYYQQLIDLKDRSVLARFESDSVPSLMGDDVFGAYWNDEAGEIKYQIGEGCEIDQVSAQWHANMCGLGEIFDPVRRKTALQALYRHNFKPEMRDFPNPCRIFCLNDEGGIVICEWPDGKLKPAIPLPYSEETMNGYEYQAAIHMIQEGFFEEGMTIVKAIRDRYDGEKRNPWNEIECGSNYARSMASYSLVPTLSGFVFDMVNGMIGFDPIVPIDAGYQTFWSVDSGWGIFSITSDSMKIEVLYGSISIQKLSLPGEGFGEMRLDGNPVAYSEINGALNLDSEHTLLEGGILEVTHH